MKRTLVLLTAAALAASPAVADAAKKPRPTKRVVTFDYTGVFGVYSSAAGGGGVCEANPDACFVLSTLPYEKKVSFTATDATGQEVPVQWDLDGDYDNNTVSCSKGEIPVRKGTTVEFFFVAGTDCAGLPTSGTLTMTVTGLK